MQADGLNKQIYHWLSTSHIMVGLSLKVCMLHINSLIEKINGFCNCRTQLLHS